MLTSPQNPLVKQIRQLHTAKGRREEGLFILEGTHLVEAACAVNWDIMAVCCTPQWEERHRDLWELAVKRADRTEQVSDRLIAAMTTTVNPDGVVAIARRRDQTPVPITSLGLVLETVQDPGNLGTMIRTATAAGVEGLWLSSDSVDPTHPKVLRASAGAWFEVPIAVHSDLITQLSDIQKQGIQIVATRADASLSYWEIDLRPPTAIVLGNEGSGLSPDLTSLADYHIRVPLLGNVESLNVAICAALILYEAQRQRLDS
ncbi:TrmH family RNA methyltransferase [Arthrospira platensis]|uniref:tRNA/rRNA methyltransferase n=1 Tax=Limnospira platensis NIES-46 TaxID=1236695 RepID=A0A5M3TAR2_LIMPL|nr:RNA methyltransferase [Arthrospira platensis]AMW31393.1 rRNA methyltransferase [Arthrospira platensis YZ]KDR56127.1 rRNA methyltransferase [Arthrospira platensis str. Paraca]MBD2671280.1 RNA methyltransferase [Arthrospira platensis FACHB-439]MBD2712247.1 RNA methyltransferase [Arthrospira platensis FACHB-835]MDF2208886.1 RNA methyltransferase [Arthrospira platensis NCB002]MDT9184851.1 RNA methyltransferase [Limnospira sp. PMC 289.06]MDT9312567.1 RNA methyltransferase [Limnospira sp. Parac